MVHLFMKGSSPLAFPAQIGPLHFQKLKGTLTRASGGTSTTGGFIRAESLLRMASQCATLTSPILHTQMADRAPAIPVPTPTPVGSE